MGQGEVNNESFSHVKSSEINNKLCDIAPKFCPYSDKINPENIGGTTA